MTDLSAPVAPAIAVQRAITVLAAINRTQGLVEYDRDGRVLDANQYFLDLMGYTLEQIAGRAHRLFCSATGADADLWHALLQGQYDSGEYLRVTAGGRRVWLQGSYNPVFDEHGAVIKVIQLAYDITARVGDC